MLAITIYRIAFTVISCYNSMCSILSPFYFTVTYSRWFYIIISSAICRRWCSFFFGIIFNIQIFYRNPRCKFNINVTFITRVLNFSVCYLHIPAAIFISVPVIYMDRSFDYFIICHFSQITLFFMKHSVTRYIPIPYVDYCFRCRIDYYFCTCKVPIHSFGKPLIYSDSLMISVF